MLYNPSNWQLMLVGNEKSFTTQKKMPPYLANTELLIGGEWLRALTALNDELLYGELSDVLSKRQIQAIGARRDALIETAAAQ
jgi:hypothetical protein